MQKEVAAILSILLISVTAQQFTNQNDHKSMNVNDEVLSLVQVTSSPSLRLNINKKQQKRSHKIQAHHLSNMFEQVMVTYDRKFRPRYGGDADEIKLELHVLSFSDFDEGAMEFGMDFYFAQFWNDPRFKVDKTHENPIINLVGVEIDRLWLPDTVFVNSKSSKFHDVTVENRFLSINFSDGEVVYHARITTVASCRMDLRDYPFDQQTCYLAIESYGHDDNDLLFQWFDPTEKNCTALECQKIFVYDKEMSNFDVVEAIKSKNKTKYHASKCIDTAADPTQVRTTRRRIKGAFSTATAQFTFQRRTQYFLLQVYLPCILIVMVTWTTFWITPKAVPARSAICVTTILTLITMLGIVNVNMPKVSYIKALDLYLFVSFIFVFLSLLEYIIVLNVANKRKKRRKVNEKNEEKEKNMKELKHYISNSKETNNNNSLYQEKRACNCSTRANHQCYNHPTSNRNYIQNTRSRRHYCKQHFNSNDDTVIDIDTLDNGFDRCLSADIIDEGIDSNSVLIWQADTTDVIARFLFPIAFACFNVGYWTSYLSQKTEFQNMI